MSVNNYFLKASLPVKVSQHKARRYKISSFLPVILHAALPSSLVLGTWQASSKILRRSPEDWQYARAVFIPPGFSEKGWEMRRNVLASVMFMSV